MKLEDLKLSENDLKEIKKATKEIKETLKQRFKELENAQIPTKYSEKAKAKGMLLAFLEMFCKEASSDEIGKICHQVAHIDFDKIPSGVLEKIAEKLP